MDPGSMYRKDNPTKKGKSVAQTLWSLIDAAALPQDPTVKGVREVVISFNG